MAVVPSIIRASTRRRSRIRPLPSTSSTTNGPVVPHRRGSSECLLDEWSVAVGIVKKHGIAGVSSRFLKAPFQMDRYGARHEAVLLRLRQQRFPGWKGARMSKAPQAFDQAAMPPLTSNPWFSRRHGFIRETTESIGGVQHDRT